MMLKLYHGSLTEFSDIDVTKGKGFKDFGKGFYTTANRGHAERIAKRNLKIELDKQSKLGVNKSNIKAYLKTFSILCSIRNIKVIWYILRGITKKVL